MSKKTSNYEPGFSSPKKPSAAKQHDTDSASLNGERLISNLDILSTKTVRRKGRRRAECSLLVFELDEKNIRLMLGDKKDLVFNNLHEMVKDGCKPLFLSKSKEVLKEIKREFEHGVHKLLKDYTGNKLKEYVMRIITSNITDKFQGDNSVYVGTLFDKSDMTYAPFSFGHVLSSDVYFQGAQPRPKRKKDIVDQLLEDNDSDSFDTDSDITLSSELTDLEESKVQEPSLSKSKPILSIEPPKPTKDKPKTQSIKRPLKEEIDTIFSDDAEEDNDPFSPNEKPKTLKKQGKPGRPPKVKTSPLVQLEVGEVEPKKKRGRPAKKKEKDPEDQTTSISPTKNGAELEIETAEPKDAEVVDSLKSDLVNPGNGEFEKTSPAKKPRSSKKGKLNLIDMSDDMDLDTSDNLAGNIKGQSSRLNRFNEPYNALKSLSKKISGSLTRSLTGIKVVGMKENRDSDENSPNAKSDKNKIVKRKRNFEDDIFFGDHTNKLTNITHATYNFVPHDDTQATLNKIRSIKTETREYDSFPIQKRIKGSSAYSEKAYRSPPNSPVDQITPNKSQSKDRAPETVATEVPPSELEINIEEPVKLPENKTIADEADDFLDDSNNNEVPDRAFYNTQDISFEAKPTDHEQVQNDKRDIIIPEKPVEAVIEQPIEKLEESVPERQEEIQEEIKLELPIEKEANQPNEEHENKLTEKPVDQFDETKIETLIEKVDETANDQPVEKQIIPEPEPEPIIPEVEDVLVFEYSARIPGERTSILNIFQSDFDSLKEDTHLTNKIINFFLKFIHAELVDSSVRSSIHIFSSELFDHLRAFNREESKNFSETYAKIKQYTKDIDIFEKDYLVFPCYEKSLKNWSLYIVCFPSYFQLKEIFLPGGNPSEAMFNKPYMLYMDPLGSLDTNFASLLSVYIEFELMNRKPLFYEAVRGSFNMIKPNRMHQVPQQQKPSDSGIYVLEYAEIILTQIDTFLQDLYKNLSRIHMFPHRSLYNKREDIKKLILDCINDKSSAVKDYKAARKTLMENSKNLSSQSQKLEDGMINTLHHGNGNGMYNDVDHGTEGVKHGYQYFLNAQDDKVGNTRNGALA